MMDARRSDIYKYIYLYDISYKLFSPPDLLKGKLGFPFSVRGLLSVGWVRFTVLELFINYLSTENQIILA